MSEPNRGGAGLRPAIQRHYDSLAHLYRAFWGDHIHHGLWRTPSDSPRRAQEQLIELLAQRATLRAGERVLDVGCGYGGSARWLADRFGARVTGITISRAQARIATRLSRSGDGGGGRRLPVVVADAARLPFSNGAFDLVWVIECLEHLEDKAAFIQKCASLLRPGGRLALCSWQRTGRPDGDELVAQVCSAFLCPNLARLEDHESWCRSAGLRVETAEDLTTRVRATWDILRRRVSRPWIAPLRLLVSPSTRRFVDGFAAISRAYENGAMSYGLLVAARP